MLDYRTLNKIMRKYYDPRNSTSRLYYMQTTGSPGPNGSPGTRHIGGMAGVYGTSPLVRFHFGTVTDNADPDGYGRVRVQFPQWGEGFESGWAPIVRPFAGADRGMFSLPEIDEMVICAFLGDKPTRPMVLGSVYNPVQPNPFGENKDNDLKVVMTRSKMRLEMIDKEGEETITLFMKDGQMRVVMQKDKGIEIVNELGDINVKCRKLIIESADTVNYLFEKDCTITADEISIEANKGIAGKAGGNVVIEGSAIELEGSGGVTASNKQIAAEGDMVVGTDIHIEMVPSGNGTAPAPIPNPYIGELKDKLSSDVKVKGKYAATKGSISKAKGPGHILLPPGVKWQKSPSNKGEVFSGTEPTVKINNKEAAVIGSVVKTCADPADTPTSNIVAVGVPIKIPVMVPGMDKGQFERDGGVVVNTREPVAKEGASNEKDYALKSPKWSKTNAKCGEEVELSVQCRNLYEMANVYFAVWKDGADRETDAPVKKITGQNQGGKAAVKWKYFAPKDLDEPLTEKPKFIFTVDAFRCEQVESGTVEMGADYDIEVIDLNGNILSNTDCKIIAADNEEQQATTNDEGVVTAKNVVPGNLVIVPQLKDEQGNEIGLYVQYIVKKGDTLDQIIEKYKEGKLFDNKLDITVDSALTPQQVWNDEENREVGCICYKANMEKEGKNADEMKLYPREIVMLKYEGIIIRTT